VSKFLKSTQAQHRLEADIFLLANAAGVVVVKLDVTSGQHDSDLHLFEALVHKGVIPHGSHGVFGNTRNGHPQLVLFGVGLRVS